MALAASVANETVTVSQVYQAEIERVFEAWSNPQAIGQWFGPQSHSCHVDEYDFREGGKYRLGLTPIDDSDSDCGSEAGKASVCGGEFVQIIPGKLIVMSFTWLENAAEIGDTLLTIELSEHADGTELSLTHERLPDEELRNAHMEGWQSTLENLEAFIGQ